MRPETAKRAKVGRPRATGYSPLPSDRDDTDQDADRDSDGDDADRDGDDAGQEADRVAAAEAILRKRRHARNTALLQFADLAAKGIPYSRSHLWRLIQKGLFPPPFKIVDAPGAINCWSEDVIDAFLEARQAAHKEEAAA
jgi:predicted DNA-binding transcriptional regulator AlpA